MAIHLSYLVVGVLALVQLPHAQAALTSSLSLSSKLSCDAQIMDTCNTAAKSKFEDLAVLLSATATDTNKYCKAMKNLHQCVAGEVMNNPCASDTLTKYYFVVLAYLRMEKLMPFCTGVDAIDPSNMQGVIMKKAQNLLDYKGSAMETFVNEAIDKTPSAGSFPLTEKKHKVCIERFSKSEQNSLEFCGGLDEFIQCYVSNPNDEKLYIAFKDVIESLSVAFSSLYSDKNLEMCSKNSLSQ